MVKFDVEGDDEARRDAYPCLREPFPFSDINLFCTYFSRLKEQRLQPTAVHADAEGLGTTGIVTARVHNTGSEPLTRYPTTDEWYQRLHQYWEV
ncbi:hypothetical protein MRX96_020171 [Rhipicephalus microplus]